MKKVFTLILGSTILFASCQKKDVDQPTTESVAETEQDSKISKEILEKIASLNFNSNDVEIFERTILNGETEEAY
ncbi:hypothetical protein [Christiangramia sp. SM2212]|uniref:Uncharacterized protein n=1 Tax=Christiangramia sediminicola TaxID=3073267 RepID=A0ABU1ERS7_9FLAO|nr:hypothetical protein [Christiangramia sp. SM2212]MDR5591100.1 hypothetical protein [Christiangramia sp. SM2212]